VSEIITHLRGIELPNQQSDPSIGAGHWEATDCAGWSAAVKAAGGLNYLGVWSTLTDPEGQYGPPTIYTCWGERHGEGNNPVAADANDGSRTRPCNAEHAVWVSDLPAPEGEHS
jgi:hypothetical protein